MDETKILAQFAAELPALSIPADVLHMSARLVVDYLGVSLGAWDEPAVRIAQQVAEDLGGAPQATLIGGGRTSLLHAATINGIGNTLANTLIGNAAANALNGGNGADTFMGGLGDDLYVLDNAGDSVVEAIGEGTDKVQSSVTYALTANVENLTLIGVQAINGTGNGLANVVAGNDANNILDGGAGVDKLTGGLGSDTFVFGTLDADKVTDFVSGTDKVRLLDGVGGLSIGNGDHIIDNAMLAVTSGGFANTAELVVVGPNIVGGITAAKAATAIGSAASSYALGDSRLFVVDNGADSAMYLFKSAGADALVSSTELTLVGTLQGTAQTALADYAFA